MASIPITPGYGGIGSTSISGQVLNPATGQDSAPPSGSPGSAYVWSDNVLKVGPFDTGIHTRVLKDIAVMIGALALLILGVLLMAKPDINAAIKTAEKALPLAAA